MSRSYTFQGEPISAPVSITSNQPVFDAETISLKRQRVITGAQRWELEFNTTPRDPGAFFRQQVNGRGTRTMVMPQIHGVADVTGTTVMSAGATTAGATAVPVDIPSGSISIPAGRFIKFAGHDKIYMVTEDENVRPVPAGISIFPPLVADVADNEVVHYSDEDTSLIFTGYRDSTDINGITFEDGVLARSGTIRLYENL